MRENRVSEQSHGAVDGIGESKVNRECVCVCSRDSWGNYAHWRLDRFEMGLTLNFLESAGVGIVERSEIFSNLDENEAAMIEFRFRRATGVSTNSRL